MRYKNLHRVTYGCFFRDEEDKLVEEILARNKKTKNEKPEMFRAHQVPIESQIPLFDKIMEEQEMRYGKNDLWWKEWLEMFFAGGRS